MTTSNVDLAISASWIVPVVPENRILENCSIVVNKGKIEAICATSDLEQRYKPTKHFSLPGQALLPGMINTHGHAAMTLLRGYADDKSLDVWLQEHIWPAEQKWVNEKFVTDGSRLAVAEMISRGTTCFADMYFYPEATASVAFESGIRAQINFPILDFPTAWASDSDEYLRKGLALHDEYRSHDLITVGFGPHAPYTVSDEPLKRIVTYAEELQSPIQIHLHETEKEVLDSIEQFGMRPIERLSKLGLLTPYTQCVHMTQIADSDIELLTSSGAHIVHCPESNLKLASGICPVQKLLDNNINVCLGTDGAASNNDLDLFGEMQTAALIGKYRANDASAVKAASALEMATINGAKAMGLEDKIGSLEIGKDADIIAVNMQGLSSTPMYDLTSQLTYTQAGHKVSHTWVKGKTLMDDYKLTTINTAELAENIKEWQNAIK